MTPFRSTGVIQVSAKLRDPKSTWKYVIYTHIKAGSCCCWVGEWARAFIKSVNNILANQLRISRLSESWIGLYPFRRLFGRFSMLRRRREKSLSVAVQVSGSARARRCSIHDFTRLVLFFSSLLSFASSPVPFAFLSDILSISSGHFSESAVQQCCSITTTVCVSAERYFLSHGCRTYEALVFVVSWSAAFWPGPKRRETRGAANAQPSTQLVLWCQCATAFRKSPQLLQSLRKMMQRRVAETFSRRARRWWLHLNF